MKIGERGLALIKSFEKLALVAYPDQGGVWTIGWGHTLWVKPGTTCSEVQADIWLQDDLRGAVDGVSRTLTRAIPQNAFDALVAFAFNAGVGAEGHSTLARLVNAGDMAGAAEQFGLWVHVNGQVSNGLVRRRAAERDLFLTPDPSPAT